MRGWRCWGILLFIILWQLARKCYRLFDCGMFKNGRDKREPQMLQPLPHGRRWLQAQEIAGALIVSKSDRKAQIGRAELIQW